MKQIRETVYGKGAREVVVKIARDYQAANPYDTVVTRQVSTDGYGAWACFARPPEPLVRDPESWQAVAAEGAKYR